jgi:hypothetical protein
MLPANNLMDVLLIDERALEQMRRYRVVRAHEFTEDVLGNLYRGQGDPRRKPAG